MITGPSVSGFCARTSTRRRRRSVNGYWR
jgi:hypothetical protein